MADNSWKLAKLDEVAICRNGAGVKQEFFTDVGVPLVRVSDFTVNSINLHHCINIDAEHANRWKEHRLVAGEVLVATVGSWPPNWSSVVGKVVQVPSNIAGAIQNQNTACIIARPNKANQRFLYYLLKSKEFISYAANSAHGSANQARLSVANLERFTFNLPPLSEQNAIARILGTLDDKIELNHQMNETLEAMAKAIFKSWFVDFDPVRAKLDGRRPQGMVDETVALFPNSLENSALGEIPQGWNVATLSEVVAINGQSITKAYRHKTIKYIDISSVTEGRLEEITSYALNEAPSRAKRLVKHGDTIWSTVRPNRKSFLFIYDPLDNLVLQL